MTTWRPESAPPEHAATHAVQFYESEQVLYDTVGEFLAAGVSAGEPLLIIATPEHRDAFAATLRAKGVNHDSMVFADARDTLARFMDGDVIDESRFRDVVGGAIAAVASAGYSVRAYGEMVDLLWRDGLPDAAIRLEELWNDLASLNTFSLLCAYPIGNFYKTNAHLFSEVCRNHNHVVPAHSALIAEIEQRKELEQALRDSLAARRQAEEALRRSERQLKDFVDNATVGLHWVGADGTILWANDAELKLLGYAREEYVGRNIADFHADGHVIQDILRRLSAGEELYDYEARLSARDGTVKCVSINSNVLFEDGRFVHTRCFTRDITDRKRIEESNARLYERAQESNRAKDEFLATLSHELRTPLTAVLGWAKMLSMGGLDAETTRTAVETIERSARTQASLIDDLLDLSRIVTGKLTLERNLVDLGSVIENAAQTQRLAAEAKSIRLEVKLPLDRIIVAGDATRLQQVIWNLLANAIKFSRPEGRVVLSVEGNDDSVHILVCDDGRGITAELLPHIFETFRQGEASSTRAFGGLGLGLAIVKYLVESHGGSVAASSAGENRGATFDVTLPVATPHSHECSPH